ncbi:NADP-dependent 3-hydroxy acid dehydrogenase YdfG [Filimonas lacunae]|uniref:NADP-dependent 3-hydroxy acid dehydrogenase YdfG n=1 Tax=Filimonas lacunae TaxID=477680 RepID=A0A173MLH6_9BACT|nr:SDR family NAD(P)-dependent oxidoreductase [Filimonas lacunae]BAV08337.1 oxidoreductase [Filimonas lacunae]SIT33407.1 NADP-dependent 3-hydroxy acid dehydrogenase YdfG [Filimonas lacunae]
MSKTIFITGASKGFGRIWTNALLERGDKVVATSRTIHAYDDLVKKYPDTFLPLTLDITHKQAVNEALAQAKAHFGSLDVVINNAGYGLFGAVEELEEADARAILDTNVLGTLFVTQAALPILRAQGHGHIIQLSSVLGVWSLPILGMYNASKFAVEGLSEALAHEVKGFGIHVTLVEPNGYKTEFGGGSAVRSNPIAAYDGVREQLFRTEGMPAEEYGNPEATIPALLQLIDAQNPPLRLFLGNLGLRKTKEEFAGKIAEWELWNDVAVAAHG